MKFCFAWVEGGSLSHPAVLTDYSWLCAQEWPLFMLRGPYMVQGFKLSSAGCKARALPISVQDLQSLKW